MEEGEESPLYQQLVQALDGDLAGGRLMPGDRLPTQRKLARELGVSVGTITRAYAEAERRGLVHGEVGRGTFAGRKPSDDRFGKHASDALDLALTWPLYGFDPDLGSALRAIAQRPDVTRLLEYGPKAGHPHHRSAGRTWADHNGIDAREERVLVSSGAQHAMVAVFGTLLEPGDTLLVEPHTYPGLKAVAAAQHLRLIAVPADEEGLLPDALESACRGKKVRALYTVPTIQNPTTAVLGVDRRREIVRIAEAHGFAIVEDEVHRLLHPNPPPSFGALAPELTYTILSLSKVVAGGLRLAFVVVPDGATERVSHLIWATTWMTSPLMAEIGATWVEDGTALATAHRKRAEAGARQQVAKEELAGHPFWTAPNSYHIWLPLPRRWVAAEFATTCERRGVAVTPADTFSVGREHAENAVRLAMTGVNTRDELRRGLGKVVDILGSRVTTSAVV